jgi:DNA-binding Xre family transcriptional regulator
MVANDQFDLGERLNALIARSGKQKTALASHLDVSPQAVQKWINEGTLARQHVRPICQFLHCSADELFGLTPIQPRGSQSPRESQHEGIDVEMLKSAIAATKEAFRAFNRRMDAYDSAPIIAFAYEERTRLPRLLSKAEYRAFDALVTAKLRGDFEHAEEKGGRPASTGARGSVKGKATGKAAGIGR